jgi:hypothetical protein
MRCRITLDHSEMSVMAKVEVELEDSVMIAGLDNLAPAAEIAPRNEVPCDAHTMRNLVNALTEQAKLLRLLLPHPGQETVSGLMEHAEARQWRTR